MTRYAAFETSRRHGATGLVLIVLLHAGLGYVLVSGLARPAQQLTHSIVEAVLLEQAQQPPQKELPAPPKPAAVQTERVPTPAVTPPEVTAPAPDATAAVMATQEAVVTRAPTPAPTLAPTPAPTPAEPVQSQAVQTPAPASTNIAVVCPKQTKPSMPGRAIEEGVMGTVRAQIHIRRGRVVDVQILSGPKVFHATVRSAVTQYECVATGDAEIVTTQDFSFKVQQ